MRISLIGMAGTGKSHWSKGLSERGFRRFCCDDLIEARLANDLKKADGSSMTMGEWMGLPYSPHYPEREARYLVREKEVVRDILDDLEANRGASEEDVVVDTSGSVIYTGQEYMKKLDQLTTIVLLSTPLVEKSRLLKSYLSNPHPMLWRGLYSKRKGETHEAALLRCYPKLFQSRLELYERYAQVRVDFYRLRARGFGVEDFIKEIVAAL